MKTDLYLDKFIEQKFIEQNRVEKENHISSGKLSAGMLNDPLQWQILKVLGVEPRPLEEYVLRKFFRGKQIEDWLVNEIPDVIEKQKFVEYNKCVGYFDAMVDTKNWDCMVGVIPVEIKTLSNAKYKRILENTPDKGHILQGALYGLAKKTDHFAIIYVASDDLRIKTYIYETKEFKQDIDEIIRRFYEQLATGIVPEFNPNEKWQADPKYNKYPDFIKKANIKKEELVNIKPDIIKPVINKTHSFGNPDINTLIMFLKEKLGGSLDGTIKSNRQFAYLILNRFKKDYPDKNPVELIQFIISVGLKDSFHAKNITNFKYLFYNAQKIIQSFKGRLNDSRYVKL